ncbi:hypothetical protein C8R45DRAFT_1166796 [Mycena sanguinolenta]|nr:hypothetical protein C8R45DRAFT_1166796 [Mycena sanguinolenta]
MLRWDPRTATVMPSLVSPVLTVTQASVLSGWDLAICFILFLQGVLCLQFSRYKDSASRDSVQIKLFVAGLALLTALKTSECLAMMWIQNVTLFRNAKAASALWKTAWYSKLFVLLKAAVPFYVQMFFCYRLWAGNISKLVGIKVKMHIGFVVFGDLILTGSIIFWLLQHNKTQSRQSAAPLTLSSLINFIVIMPPPSVHSSPAFLMLNFITDNILPHLYAWSAMWTLNSRDEIAAARNTPHTLNLGIASYTSDVKAGQIPHASNGAVSADTHQEEQASSQIFNGA